MTKKTQKNNIQNLSDINKNGSKIDKWTIIKENIIPITAIITLILSSIQFFVLSIYNNETLNQTKIHDKLAVTPILSFNFNLNPDDPVFPFIGVTIENRGIGPALIAPPLYLYDNEPIGILDGLDLSSQKKIFDKLKLPKGVIPHLVHHTFIIKPGEEIKIFWTKETHSKELQSYFNEIMKHIGICYAYSSIYQEEPTIIGFNGYPKQQPVVIAGDPYRWFPKKIELPKSISKM